MEEIDYTPILLIGIGAMYSYYSMKFLKDPIHAEKILNRSHKVWLWKKLLGEEKTRSLYKSVIAPWGVILGAGLVVFGIISLIL